MNIGNNEVPIGITPPQIELGQRQVPSGVNPPRIDVGQGQNPIGKSSPHIDIGKGQAPSGVKPPEIDTGNIKTPLCPPHSGIDIGCHKVPAGVRPVHWLQLDTTLTKPGYAADAYSVGNLFGRLNAPVYVVEDGTTLEQIQDAHDNDKLIVIYQDNKNYFLSDLDENGATFTTVYNDNGETYTQNIYISSDGQWVTEDPVSTTSQEEVLDLIQQALSQIDIVNGNVW